MKKLVIGFALFCAASNVVAKKPLDFVKLQGAYDGVQSHVNHNQRLMFPLPTPTALNALAQFGETAEAIKQGHIVRETYGIDDPTVEVAAAIANEISSRLQLPVTSSRNSEFRSLFANLAGLMGTKEFASQVGPGKLAVNVGSDLWGVYKKGKGRYFVAYWVTTEIIDSTQGKLLWRDICIAPIPKKDQRPETATMFENNAAALKGEIDKMRDFCTLKILKNLTGEEAQSVS